MRLINPLLILSLCAALLAACSPPPESPKGFRLPDGNPESGRQAFLDLQCHACHKLPGEQLPEISIAAPVSVMLGGPVSRVKTYGELVTAIINPSHKLIRIYLGSSSISWPSCRTNTRSCCRRPIRIPFTDTASLNRM